MKNGGIGGRGGVFEDVYLDIGGFVTGAYGIHAAGHMPLVTVRYHAVRRSPRLFVFSFAGIDIVGNFYTPSIHVDGYGCRIRVVIFKAVVFIPGGISGNLRHYRQGKQAPTGSKG